MEYKLDKPYSKGTYNKVSETEQWIRLSEGCPNKCSYCAESFENPEFKVFEIPEITRNKVNILDMNLLCKPESLEIIKNLGNRKVNNKIINYTLQCGIDWRFLTQEIASALKKSRFKNIRLAWDYTYKDTYKIHDAIKMLRFAGYNSKDIQVFMICNWKISYEECLRKLNTCLAWGVQVSDCWYDNQLPPDITPIHWSLVQIKDFRKKCRDHNIMMRYQGIQVEWMQKGF